MAVDQLQKKRRFKLQRRSFHLKSTRSISRKSMEKEVTDAILADELHHGMLSTHYPSHSLSVQTNSDDKSENKATRQYSTPKLETPITPNTPNAIFDSSNSSNHFRGLPLTPAIVTEHLSVDSPHKIGMYCMRAIIFLIFTHYT